MSGTAKGVVSIVTASAGTGKTWRLENEVREAITSGDVSPERILAVTFTRDAARQLMERARARLFQVGMRQEAQRLLNAPIGTVHGVFGGLLADFALEAGRSPKAQVVPDGANGALFRIAADVAIATHAPVLNRLAQHFDHGVTGRDWREMVREVVDLARQNGLRAADLAASAEASWQGLSVVLAPPAGTPGDELDAALAKALTKALAALVALAALPGGDRTKDTQSAIETLRAAARDLDQGALPWPLWAKLATLKTGAKSHASVLPVHEAAAVHTGHPRLREELQGFIRAIFACATDALDAWQSFKAERGLVDFADQEAAAFAMLDRPAVQARFAEEVELLLVDEFQDTSPIQLALFLKLAALLPRSLWVGDPKQAIYGFRGTDPELMQAVAGRLPALTGGGTETLDQMRRSRPALVSFVNDAFRDAFMPAVTPTQVVVKPWRVEPVGLPPALQVWRVHGGNVDHAASALADGVAAMLEDRDLWPVPEWAGRAPGPLRGGDIAILCRSNDRARGFAEALAAAGLKVALGRSGLLARAECLLALAGLRRLADRSDTAALAEIAHVLEGDNTAPAWLAAALEPGGLAGIAGGVQEIVALEGLREHLNALTPAETLDAAIAALGLPQKLVAWGDATARLANLDELRGLAIAHEGECRQSGWPATASGLSTWIVAQEAEEPANPDPDAVRVLTVHKSKGLEWPIVIVTDLDSEPRGRLFDQPVAMPRADAVVDPLDPLAGRTIRLWPWPYAKQQKDTALGEAASMSAVGLADAAAAESEAVRLLYVAMTRARDWLVLAPRVKGATNQQPARLQTKWLSLLGRGAPELPLVDNGSIRIGEVMHPCAVKDLHPLAATHPVAATHAVGALLPKGNAPHHPPRIIRPSAVEADAIGAAEFTSIHLGPRLPFAGTPDMAAVGEALHGFLAADRRTDARTSREAMAERLLRGWGIAALSPTDAVIAADRLWDWITARWPGATWRSEVPVFQRKGEQRVSGRIDLLVEHAQGIAVIDHKSFPGDMMHWPERATRYAPQLRSYGVLLTEVAGRPVTDILLHLPVGGVLLRLDPADTAEKPR